MLQMCCAVRFMDPRDRGLLLSAADALNNYDTLLTRHNALVEAVAWERECWDVEMWVQHRLSSPMLILAYWESDRTYKAARAEVDRLISNDENDCKGEG